MSEQQPPPGSFPGGAQPFPTGPTGPTGAPEAAPPAPPPGAGTPTGPTGAPEAAPPVPPPGAGTPPAPPAPPAPPHGAEKRRSAAPFVGLGVVAVLALVGVAALVVVLGSDDAAGATVTAQVSGQAEVCDADGECRALKDGDEVDVSAVVRTGDDGEVSLAFPDGSVVRIEPDTEVTIDEIDDEAGEVELASGAVAFEAPGDATTVVQTAAGTVTASDADGSVDCSAGDECSFTSDRNRFEVAVGGETTVVEEGDTVTFPTGGGEGDLDVPTGDDDEEQADDASEFEGTYSLTITVDSAVYCSFCEPFDDEASGYDQPETGEQTTLEVLLDCSAEDFVTEETIPGLEGEFGECYLSPVSDQVDATFGGYWWAWSGLDRDGNRFSASTSYDQNEGSDCPVQVSTDNVEFTVDDGRLTGTSSSTIEPIEVTCAQGGQSGGQSYYFSFTGERIDD